MSFADEPDPAWSTYNATKLAEVLTILNSVGVKVILVDENGNPEQWYGSQAWVNDWKQVAADFKGDSRIEAFEPCGEAYSYYLSPTGPTGGITDMHSFDVAMNYLIGQIRAIDPTRTIMYPLVDVIFTASATDFYNDLVSTGVIAQGNILYDIVHAYYFQNQNDLGLTPVEKAAWYWTNYVAPQIAYFGVANCWCGETFPFSAGTPIDGNPANGYYSYALQQEFMVAMINDFVSAGMGFQMWLFFSSSDQQAQIDALTNSNYGTFIQSNDQSAMFNGLDVRTPVASVYSQTVGVISFVVGLMFAVSVLFYWPRKTIGSSSLSARAWSGKAKNYPGCNKPVSAENNFCPYWYS
jgi:hypothetical protein